MKTRSLADTTEMQSAICWRASTLVSVLLGLFLAGMATACGGTSTTAATDDPGTVPDTVSNPVSEPTSSTSLPSEQSLPTIDDLSTLVRETAALPRLSFDLKVAMALGEPGSEVLSHRTGSFDNKSISGVGTLSFEGEDAELTAVWGDKQLEFRLIEGTFWMDNPFGHPPGWGGIDAADFAESVGGNPLAAIDANAYLGLVVAATTEIVEVQLQADETKIWLLRARADDLVPGLASGGPTSRIISLGAAESGLATEVRLHQNATGDITGFTLDAKEWWINGISLLHPPNGNESMVIDFRLEPFDQPLFVEPPCENPSTTIDDKGLATLVCEQ